MPIPVKGAVTERITNIRSFRGQLNVDYQGVLSTFDLNNFELQRTHRAEAVDS